MLFRSEGSEFLARWAKDALIHETEDGPLVVQPLPAPLWAGRLAKESQSAETAALEAGPYLFCQSRASTEEDIKDVLEWFVRECWWTRAAACAEIIMRLVREDGKTAVQALTRDIELDS